MTSSIMLIEPVPLVQLALVDTPRLLAYLRNSSSFLSESSRHAGGGGGIAKAVASTLSSSTTLINTTTTTNNANNANLTRRYQASQELLHWMVSSPVVLDSSQFTNRIYEASVSRVVESYQGVCKELWVQLVFARETIAATSSLSLEHPSHKSKSNEGAELVESASQQQKVKYQCFMCDQSYGSCKELQRHTLKRHTTTSPHLPTSAILSSPTGRHHQHSPPVEDIDYVRRELASMQQCLRQHLAAAEANVMTSHHHSDLDRFTRLPHPSSSSEVDLASKELAVLRYTAESAAMYII